MPVGRKATGTRNIAVAGAFAGRSGVTGRIPSLVPGPERELTWIR